MTKTTETTPRAKKPPELVERLRVFGCSDVIWDSFTAIVGERERSATLRRIIADFVERERAAHE